jgi:hypothetical protein
MYVCFTKHTQNDKNTCPALPGTSFSQDQQKQRQTTRGGEALGIGVQGGEIWYKGGGGQGVIFNMNLIPCPEVHHNKIIAP